MDGVIEDPSVELEEDLESDDLGLEEDLENEEREDDEDDPKGDDEDELVVVTIEGDEPEGDDKKTPAPQWVKDLRKTNREQAKKIRDLEKKVEETSTPKPEVIDPGPKPTLESADYDTNKYDQALSDWYEKKKKADDQQAEIKAAEEKRRSEWDNTLQNYEKQKKSLISNGVKNYSDSEENVAAILNKTQFGIIVSGADNPAAIIYALDQSKKTLDEISRITDPIKFAFAISRLEPKVKVSKRKPSTTPEREVRGNNNKIITSSDKKLDQLRRKAEKTGDYTEVTAYRRQLKKKGK